MRVIIKLSSTMPLAVSMNVKSNLMKKYSKNFKGVMLNYFPDCKIDQSEEDSVDVYYQLSGSDGFSVDSQSCDEFPSNLQNKFELMNDVINKFTELAIKEEVKTTEFIPLNGYSFDSLKEEVVKAVQGHRDLLLIDDYSEYKRQFCNSNEKPDSSKKSNGIFFNQYRIEYGTREYIDAVIMLWKKDSAKLRSMYNGKLEYTEWY